MKIIIAGGSGSIGAWLAEYFSKKGNDIIILSRKKFRDKNKIKFVQWDAKTFGDWAAELNGADIIINLTGKSVNCRYTEKNKKEIIESRLLATKIIGEAINKLKDPPKVWFNAASATIYRDARDFPQDEFTGEIGSDFSMNVCKAWEKCFYEIDVPHTRKIVLRMAITLGINGGVINRFKNLVRFGLGGKMSTGTQMMSWVHVEDIARSIEFLYAHENLNGIYNISSPYPVDNKEFMATIRKSMKIPFGIPTPKWFLAFGAFIIGTETELILKSRWVIPQKLIAAGFKFKYAEVGNVLISEQSQ
ncbi:MAG: TIGR01777 family oxidoreductase [Chitinophagales bacterium]